MPSAKDLKGKYATLKQRTSQQIRELTQENTRLKNNLRVGEGVRVRLEQDITANKQRVEELKGRISSLNDNMRGSTKELRAQLNGEKSELRSEMKNRQQYIKECQRSLKKAKSDLKIVNKRLEDVEDQLDRKKDLYTACQSTLKDCQGRALEASKVRDMFKRKLAEEEKKTASLRSRLDSLRDKNRAQTEQIKQLNSDLVSIRNEKSSLETAREKLQQRLDSGMSRMDDLKTKYAQLNQELADKNKIIRTISNERDGIARELDALKAKEVEIRGYLNATKEKLTEIKSDMATVRAEKTKMNAMLKRETDKSKTSQQEVDKMNSFVQNYAENMKAKNDQLDQMKQAYDMVKQDKEMLTNKMKDLRQTTSALKSRLEQTLKSEDSVRRSHNDITGQMENVENALQTTNAELAATQDKLNRAELSLSAIRQENGRLRNSLAECKTSYAQVQANLQQQTQAKAQLDRTLQTIVSNMRKTGRNDVPTSLDNQEDFNQLQRSFVDLMNEVTGMRSRVNDLLSQGYQDNRKLVAQNAEMKRALGRMQQEFKLMRQEMIAKTKMITTLETRANDSAVQAEKLTKERIGMVQQIQQYQKKLADTNTFAVDTPYYQQKIEELKAQLTGVEQQLAEAQGALLECKGRVAEESKSRVQLGARIERQKFEMESMRDMSQRASSMMRELKTVKNELTVREKQNVKLNNDLQKALRRVEMLLAHKNKLRAEMDMPTTTTKKLAELERKYSDTLSKLESSQRRINQFKEVEANLRGQNQNLNNRLSQIMMTLQQSNVATDQMVQYDNARQELDGFSGMTDEQILQNQRDNIAQLEKELAALNGSNTSSSKKKIIQSASKPSDLVQLVPAVNQTRREYYDLENRVNHIKTALFYMSRKKKSSQYELNDEQELVKRMLNMEAKRLRLKGVSAMGDDKQNLIINNAHHLARDQLLHGLKKNASKKDMKRIVEAYERIVSHKRNSIQQMQSDLNAQAERQQAFVTQMYDNVLPSMDMLEKDMQAAMDEYEALYGKPVNLKVSDGQRQRLFDDMRSQAEVELTQSLQRLRQAETQFAALDMEFNQTYKALKSLLHEEDMKKRDQLIESIRKVKEENEQKILNDRLASGKQFSLTANVASDLHEAKEALSRFARGEYIGDNLVQDSQVILNDATFSLNHTTIIINAGFNTRSQIEVFKRMFERYIGNPSITGPFSVRAIGLKMAQTYDVIDLLANSEDSIRVNCGNIMDCKDVTTRNVDKAGVPAVIGETNQVAGFYPVIMLMDRSSGSQFILFNLIVGQPGDIETARAHVAEQKWKQFLAPAMSDPNVTVQVYMNYDTDKQKERTVINELAMMLRKLAL